MRNKTVATKIVIVAVLIIIAGVCAWNFWVGGLHFIRADGGGGSVLWNGDEAYLFVYDCSDGFVLSILEYLTEPIREYFYAPAIPADSKCVLTVVRVTSSGVERHFQEFEGGIDHFTPLGGRIYAHCPGGVCKWNGDKFELITEEEERNIGGYPPLSEEEFSNVNGWSRRWIRGTFVGQTTPPFEFSIGLNKGSTLLVKGSNPVSVDLQRSNTGSERIWYHEQRTRWVSRATYARVFGRH
jgi:hypothetical protein